MGFRFVSGNLERGWPAIHRTGSCTRRNRSETPSPRNLFIHDVARRWCVRRIADFSFSARRSHPQLPAAAPDSGKCGRDAAADWRCNDARLIFRARRRPLSAECHQPAECAPGRPRRQNHTRDARGARRVRPREWPWNIIGTNFQVSRRHAGLEIARLHSAATPTAAFVLPGTHFHFCSATRRAVAPSTGRSCWTL